MSTSRDAPTNNAHPQGPTQAHSAKNRLTVGDKRLEEMIRDRKNHTKYVMAQLAKLECPDGNEKLASRTLCKELVHTLRVLSKPHRA